MTGHGVSVAPHRRRGIDRCEIRVPGRPWAHLCPPNARNGPTIIAKRTPPIRHFLSATQRPVLRSHWGGDAVNHTPIAADPWAAQPQPGGAVHDIPAINADTALPPVRSASVDTGHIETGIDVEQHRTPFMAPPVPVRRPDDDGGGLRDAPEQDDEEHRLTALRAYLQGWLSPEDTVLALSRRYGLTAVCVRSELEWAGWPRRESPTAPFRLPDWVRSPDPTVLAVVMGLADIVR
jgi:hypothetical protein